jgi:hypothetical protein
MSTAKVDEYREAIVEAVAELAQCDGSRVGQSTAIDSARSVLETVYGDDLDEDVQAFIDEHESDGDDDEDKD